MLYSPKLKGDLIEDLPVEAEREKNYDQTGKMKPVTEYLERRKTYEERKELFELIAELVEKY